MENKVNETNNPVDNSANANDEFSANSTEDIPQPTRKLKLPHITPIIKRGPQIQDTDTKLLTGATATPEEPPLEGSDAEAYAALKAKRAKRRRKKLVRRAVVLGVFAALIGGGVFFFTLNKQQPDTGMETITDVAMQGNFSTQIEADGTLQPLSSTIITPEVPGQIESIKVVAGQVVNEGDVLMTIKNPELDRAVAEADRALKQANNELTLAQKGLEQAKKPSNQMVTAPDAPVMDNTESAEAAVYAAQAAVESAQASYNDAIAKAALRTVKAPAAGSIVALNAQVGADTTDSFTGANGAAGPLMQIADLSKMKVTIQVEERDIASVAVDQTATITCPAFEDLSLTGRVTSIASIATGDTSAMSFDGMGGSPTFAVDILIDAPDPRLKPGMTAEVSICTQKIDNVVMVPMSTLLTDDGENYYVNLETNAETHEMKRLDVNVIAKNDEFAVVGKPADAPANQNPDMKKSPLANGDLLIIAGGTMAEGDMTVDGSASSAPEEL